MRMVGEKMVEPRPSESTDRFAKRHGVELGTSQAQAAPAALEVRHEALEVARMLRTPGRVTAAEAAEVVAQAPRERAPAVHKVWARERSVERFATGEPGSMLVVRNAFSKALEAVEKIGRSEAAAVERIATDEDLSEAGKQRRREEVRAEHDAKRGKVEGFAMIEELLDPRQAVLERAWNERNEAPRDPTLEERFLDQMRITNALGVSRAGGNDERLCEVTLRAAAAGDATLAAGLLELLAIAGRDPLRAQLVARQLGAETASLRRAQLLGDAGAMEVVVELLLVRQVREGLRSLRDFLRQHPLEVGLARQQLGRLFEELDA